MYIIDGIAYAGEPKKPVRVISVHPTNDFTLWLRFSNGEEKTFDMKPLLEEPCFSPLKDSAIFHSVYADYGTAVWCDGSIDIAPEKLYGAMEYSDQERQIS